jgi:hypothetical protein
MKKLLIIAILITGFISCSLLPPEKVVIKEVIREASFDNGYTRYKVKRLSQNTMSNIETIQKFAVGDTIMYQF